MHKMFGGILQQSYAHIGGIKGSGFENVESMIKNIPMWKIIRKNNKIVAVILYKDKNGRKLVALGTDGTKVGKDSLKDAIKGEISTKRSYGEVSDSALNFILKIFGDDFYQYVIDPKQAGKILNKEVTPLDNVSYTRKLGDKHHKKVMFGKPGQKIKKY